MVGTVAYMPPEQALGRAPDARSDLYALGAMLYEMVTGRPPFLGDDAVAIISQHINTPPVAPVVAQRRGAARARGADPRAARQGAGGATGERRGGARGAGGDRVRGRRRSASGAAPRRRTRSTGSASGVFVGREREMDELRAGLEDALSGRGRLVLLVGEPGIGKTRTAEELATYARLRGAQVLWGRCYEGEGAPAYWPWVQAIRAYVHDRDPQALLSEMGSGAADIAQVVSEVRERLPGPARRRRARARAGALPALRQHHDLPPERRRAPAARARPRRPALGGQAVAAAAAVPRARAARRAPARRRHLPRRRARPPASARRRRSAS